MTLPVRLELPSRRRTYRIKTPISIGGSPIRFLVELGVSPSGKALEIFLVSGAGKSGSMLRAVGDDIAVALSHLLQAGYPPMRVKRMFAPGGPAHQVCRVAQGLAIEAWRDARAARRLGVR